jgi:hypothetical protein
MLNALSVSTHSRRRFLGVLTSFAFGLTLASCQELVTDQYEATAITTYAWQAEYRPQGVSPDRPRDTRIETFETNSLVNTNGQPTVDPTGERDSQGIWWPALPPKPTVEELEARQKAGEVYSEPLLQKQIEYSLTFDNAGSMVTLPTDATVYRTAVKASEEARPLKLLLGAQDGFVQKAEVQ